jgi:hypothetical protein
VYWKEIRLEAWMRAKSEQRPIISIARIVVAALIAITVLCVMRVTIPITVIVTAGSAITTFLLFLFYDWCRHVVAIPPKRHVLQKETIADQERQIAKLTAEKVSIGGYSQAQLTKLKRLRDAGNELFKVSISVNAPNPRNQRDKWLKQHDDWHDDTASILNDRDLKQFTQPFTAGAETEGQKGAYDQLHGTRRGHLFEECQRLTKILERNQA